MNQLFALILFAHVSGAGSGDYSNSMTTVPGFLNPVLCQTAGEAAKKLAAGTVKEIRYVCVRTQ